MSAAADIIVNLLDGAAFGLAGAEIFGKEKLRLAVDWMCNWAGSMMKREDEAHFYNLPLVKMVAVVLVVLMAVTWFGVYTSDMRSARIAGYYLLWTPFLAVFLVLGLAGISRFYKQLLTLYDQPLALLKLGAYLFLLARIWAITDAWEELPSAAEVLYLDRPDVYLGAGFEQFRLWSVEEAGRTVAPPPDPTIYARVPLGHAGAGAAP